MHLNYKKTRIIGTIMVVNSIYKDNKLVVIKEPFQHTEKSPFTIPEGYKGVTILYEYEEAAKLPDDMATFLSRVIEGGLKLDPAQVLTANLCHSDVTLQKLAEQAKSKVVVIFGLQWLDSLKNANIRKNQIVKLYGMKVLATDTLDVINANDAAKKAFWVELKKIL